MLTLDTVKVQNRRTVEEAPIGAVLDFRTRDLETLKLQRGDVIKILDCFGIVRSVVFDFLPPVVVHLRVEKGAPEWKPPPEMRCAACDRRLSPAEKVYGLCFGCAPGKRGTRPDSVQHDWYEVRSAWVLAQRLFMTRITTSSRSAST